MGLDERLRQTKVTDRRRNSGFKTKKYHLFDRDLVRLKKLAKEMGYDCSKKISSEDFSAIIRTCIAERYAHVFPEKKVKVPLSQEDQYLYKVKQIIAFRVMSGDSDSAISEFMMRSNYPTPTYMRKKQGKTEEFTPAKWTAKVIAELR